jgi:hypothetical protein
LEFLQPPFADAALASRLYSFVHLEVGESVARLEITVLRHDDDLDRRRKGVETLAACE